MAVAERKSSDAMQFSCPARFPDNSIKLALVPRLSQLTAERVSDRAVEVEKGWKEGVGHLVRLELA